MNNFERRLQLVEDKVERLERVEQGLIPYSNDPTEIEIASRELEGMPQRKLHTFAIKIEGEDVVNRCLVCNVNLSDCGATEDSWYCD